MSNLHGSFFTLIVIIDLFCATTCRLPIRFYLVGLL